MKRRKKREKDRLLKKQAEGELDPETVESELKNLKQVASDEFSSKQIIRTDSKILSFDFEPRGRGKEFLISFYNNTIELYHRKKQTGTPLSP